MNALILQHLPDHKHIATTNGGEWQGPCPFCGGKDRFYVQPARDGYRDRGGYAACRQCEYSNDAIDLVQQLTRCSYPEARRALMLGEDASYSTPSARPARRPRGKKAPRRKAPPATRRKASGLPPEAWQRRGCALLRGLPLAVDVPEAWAYLRGRGFDRETIGQAGIRWNSSDTWEARAAWGLEEIINPDTGKARKVYIPKGWVIPQLVYGALWGIRVRRTGKDVRGGKGKYQWVKGSRPTLYQADALRPDHPAIMVEGVFNLLSIRQAAGDLITPVAAGSTTYCRAAHWQRLLSVPPVLLISFDNDANQAGATGAAYWLGCLSNARAWFTPAPGLDVNDLLRMGGTQAVRAFVEAGLKREKTGPKKLPDTVSGNSAEAAAPTYSRALLERADEILQTWGARNHSDVVGPLACWLLFESDLPASFWDGHAIDAAAGLYASAWLHRRIPAALKEGPSSPAAPYLRCALQSLFDHVHAHDVATPEP